MPGKVKVKIIAGRNLPVMDRSSDTTDAYVEIKLSSTTYKTEVCRKSLNPQWNSDWFKFEVDDSDLQDEPLQIRLMDHDTYSANDSIGKVYLDLNPLLLPAASLLKSGPDGCNQEHMPNSTLSGWIPVYDTMHGIRGEVQIVVKVELFTDVNKFRQSSCGVQFFFSRTIPQGYYAQVVIGFVEELVVNDDPEYQWIDKIRTPRASNEARQTLFFKLSGELQRRIGVKALDLGGNAVIGYSQAFDLEGDSGIVARGIGTVVTLVKMTEAQQAQHDTYNEELPESPLLEHLQRPEQGHQRTESVGAKMSQSPAKLNAISCVHRRSSDSDLSITPKGNSLTGSDRSGGLFGFQMMRKALIRSTVPYEHLDYMEYPFLTMSKYPPGFITCIGGVVSARSVKVLERISNLEEPETRDHWWSEIRMEIRSHAKLLNCNVVLNYQESTTICDDVCVLSATGTAVVIKPQNGYSRENLTRANTFKKKEMVSSSLERPEIGKEKIQSDVNQGKNLTESPEKDVPPLNLNVNPPCSICHTPFSISKNKISKVSKCRLCGKGLVTEVLITTIELPEGIPTVGRGCFIQSFVHRPLKDLKGESLAKEISDRLPFLEYEVHRILANKLQVKGMNAIFGLKVKITIGEKIMIGIATGTAVFLAPLPTPLLPKIASNNTSEDIDKQKLASLQKDLLDTVNKNKEIYQIKPPDDYQNGKALSDTEESGDEMALVEMPVTSKKNCILEIDDPEDVDVINLLMETRPPDGFHVVNTEMVPGLEDLEIVKNLQLFIQIWREKLQPPFNLDKNFHRLLETVYFKLRRMIPCALCDLQFMVDAPESDEIQVCVLGMALGLGDPQKNAKRKMKSAHLKRADDDMIFKMEEINQIPENSVFQTPPNSSLLHTTLSKHRQKSPQRKKPEDSQRHTPHRERHGVDLTPLSYVPGGKIERYLGNLNFFFIRETTSIREEGGLSGFIHSFITEVLAIVRAHVTALGGNAMVAYFMSECVLNHNAHKNRGRCLVNVGGDVVYVSYFPED